MCNKWAARYSDGDDTFFDLDAATSDYLTNLHFTQLDVCSSSEGSSCAPGYDGGIMNAEVLVGNNTQLTGNKRASKLFFPVCYIGEICGPDTVQSSEIRFSIQLTQQRLNTSASIFSRTTRLESVQVGSCLKRSVKTG